MHHKSSQPCACTLLRKAGRAVTRLYDEQLASHGMTVTQFSILRNVDRAGTCALSRLAELLVMDRTSLYRTIAPIERAGWIAIEPGHGRAKVARLTPLGEAAMHGAEGDWEAAQTRMLGDMPAADWQALQVTLTRMIEAARP